MDVSHRSLEIAAEKIHLDRLPPKQRERIELVNGSLTYRDKRLAAHDAAAVVEVIEHLDEPRLAAFERVLERFSRRRSGVAAVFDEGEGVVGGDGGDRLVDRGEQ
jgi:hypothetical protein